MTKIYNNMTDVLFTLNTSISPGQRSEYNTYYMSYMYPVDFFPKRILNYYMIK